MADRSPAFDDAARRNLAMFHSRQVGAGSNGYHPNSVLEPITRSSVGYGSSDQPRIMPGGSMLPTQNGSTPETYDRRTWMSAY